MCKSECFEIQILKILGLEYKMFMQFMCILRIFSNILLHGCCTIYNLNLINIINTDLQIQRNTLETETSKKILQ